MSSTDHSTKVQAESYTLREFFFSKQMLSKTFVLFVSCLMAIFITFFISTFILNAYGIIGSFLVGNLFVMFSFARSRNIILPISLYLAYNVFETITALQFQGDYYSVITTIAFSIGQALFGVFMISFGLLRFNPLRIKNSRKILYAGVIGSSIVLTLMMMMQALPNEVTL